MQTQTTVTHRLPHQVRRQSMVSLAMSFDKNYDELLNKLQDQTRPDHKPFLTNNNIEVYNGKQRLEFTEADIHWVEAAGDYLFIHTKDGSSKLIRKTMKAMEDILDEHKFVRIHRSYIVNLAEICHFGNNIHREKIVTLNNGHELNVSRRFKHKVAAALSA